jgi:hypothetical protein
MGKKNQTRCEPFKKRKMRIKTSDYEKRKNCPTLFFMT